MLVPERSSWDGDMGSQPCRGKGEAFGGKGEKKLAMAVEGMGQGRCGWWGLAQSRVQSCATPGRARLTIWRLL